MNLNKAFVLGNLTRDPDKKSLPSGQPVVSFGIATNRFFTGQDGQKKEDVEFHNIVIFGKLAETAAQYLRKGSLVLIEGRLKTRNWQDAGGIKHYRTEVIAERMQLGPRGASGRPPVVNQVVNPPREPLVAPATVVSDEEIPIIEETPAQPSEETKNPKNADNDPADTEKEIDVSAIPF